MHADINEQNLIQPRSNRIKRWLNNVKQSAGNNYRLFCHQHDREENNIARRHANRSNRYRPQLGCNNAGELKQAVSMCHNWLNTGVKFFNCASVDTSISVCQEFQQEFRLENGHAFAPPMQNMS